MTTTRWKDNGCDPPDSHVVSSPYGTKHDNFHSKSFLHYVLYWSTVRYTGCARIIMPDSQKEFQTCIGQIHF